MNIYDMLRLMIDRGNYREHEVRDMTACIDHAQSANLFGNIALESVQEHVCVADGRKPPFVCIYCRNPV